MGTLYLVEVLRPFPPHSKGAKAKVGQKRAAPGKAADQAADGEWDPGEEVAPPPAKKPRGRPRKDGQPPLEKTDSKKAAESLKKKLLPSKRGRPARR